MGRRALRKIDPDLDLSRHFVELKSIDPNQEVQSLFDAPRPLEVEVGSGKGLFLRRAAAQRPGHNFLGIEIAGKYARFSAAQLAKRSLPNAVMLHGDAVGLLFDHLEESTLRGLHVYFPDPWWKKRHHKRRIMREEVVRRMEALLEPGGHLHFWTDVCDYFEATIELLKQTTGLEGPMDVDAREAEHDLDYQTHFERRMRLHDEAVYRSLFRKPELSQ